jgi:hypothetical protein
MMFVSPHLKFDPTESLSPDVERLCDLEAEIPPEVNLESFRAGQWWVYPLGRAGGSHLVGLRLTPGRTLASSAVVVAKGAQAMTIASSPAYLVPIRLHDRLRRGGASWDEIAGLSKAEWKALVELHHTLGGTDDLTELRKLTTDKAVKAAYEKGAQDYRAMATARAESQQRLDRAPETQVYARYVLAAALDRVAPTPTPEAGCWNEALASLALYMSQNDPDGKPHRDDELWAAWRVMHGLPGLDTARSGTGINVDVSVPAAVALDVSAAKVVTKRKDAAWAADPRLPAIEKLATSKKYDGAAHLDAAAALEQAKDHAGAFEARIAATYWKVHATGAADRSALDEARTLARTATWTEVADALDELYEAQEESEAEAGD